MSYSPVNNPLNQETELTVSFDVANSMRPREIKISVKDVDDYQSGSDARMRVDRKIESLFGHHRLTLGLARIMHKFS